MFEIFKDFNFCLKVMKVTGMWKLNTENLWMARMYYLYRGVIWFFLVVLFNSTQYVDLYLLGSDLQKISLNCCGSVITSMSLLLAVEIHRKFQTINVLRIRFEENEKNKIFEKEYSDSTNEMSLMNQIFCVSILFVGSVWPMTAFFDPDDRKLPYPQWVPINLRPMSVYIIVCTFQIVIGYYVCVFILGSGLLVMAFFIRIINEYKVLETKIKFLKDLNSEERDQPSSRTEGEVFKLVQGIVMKHQEILLCIKEFQHAFNTFFFIQLGSYSALYAIVGLGVVVIASKEINLALINQIVYLMTMVFYVFLLCLYGTRIIQKSYDIAHAVYDLPWYEMTPRIKQSLRILICQAQRAPDIKAGSLLKINLVTYLHILRFTYEIFMMCRSFMMTNN